MCIRDRSTATLDISIAGPEASFTVDVTSGVAPLTVQFTDNSAAAATGFLWDFGDGLSTSTMQSPSFTFTTAGFFEVTLTADVGGCPGAPATTTIAIADTAPCDLVSSETISGAGCGSAGPLSIGLASDPIDGDSLSFNLSNVPASATLGIVHLGVGPLLDIPMDSIGGTGCVLDVTPIVSLPVTTISAPSASSAEAPLAPGTAQSLVGAVLNAQSAMLADSENPLGVITSDTSQFSIGCIGPTTDPATLGGIVVQFEGSNSFTSPSSTPFWNVHNNSTIGEVIRNVTIDFLAGGLSQEFDVDQLGINGGNGEFDLGNSRILDPANCLPNNSYVSTDIQTGLVYAGTREAGCGAVAAGATTGYRSVGVVGTGPNVTDVRFEFTNFLAGQSFRFNADTDGGGTGAADHAPAVVTIVTDQRTLLGSLTVIDADTAVLVFP